jgi:hypothetical protein
MAGRGGKVENWLDSVKIENCQGKKYGNSCCRPHYKLALGRALGLCQQCGERNRHKSTSELCSACYEQTDERKNWHYMKKYGIPVSEYNSMYELQNGLCAICERPPQGNTAKWGRMCVDHDHETGKVRKLLCFNCNTVLGKMQDNPKLLRKAADYLERESNG